MTQALDKIGQLHQLADPKARTPLGENTLGIRGEEVRPLRGNGAQFVVTDLQQ